MKNVFIFGLTGRMGQEIQNIVEKTPDLNFIGGYSRSNKNPKLDVAPDIVIDFSLPEAFDDLKSFMGESSACLVSGTTGLSSEQKKDLQSLAQNRPVFWAANMSFGIHLMSQLTEVLARYDRFYKLHVEETHHIHKKDKPSGTAIIIEKAAQKSTKNLGETLSFREGEVFGEHVFIAQSANEKIEIRHEAFNRGLFAQGAVDVGLWLSQQANGFYNMDDFFKD